MSIVERTVVVPRQDEVVEITLRMSQTQANKVRTLLGLVVAGDKDTCALFDALRPVTARLPATYSTERHTFEF